GPQVITNVVSRAPFEFVVIEQGEVESANATELRCEVKSRGTGGGGITILEVVPEGTMVQPGDVIVRLDSSALEQENVTQQIKCNSQESLVIQAKNTLEAAKIARTEYLEGTYKNEEALILNEIFVAEQALRTAETGLASAQRLAARNIITALQLEGAQFNVDKARNDVDAAQNKLNALRKYTQAKMLKQFDSDIATADAKVKAEESSYQLELDKLKEIEDQITKCVISAPNAGQVVYCNRYNSGRSGSTAEFVVEAGSTVREQQPIIRLPRSNEMKVKATVNEARVTLVRPGLPVSIRVDALKDVSIMGEVEKVNQYAEPGSWSGGNVKKYATFVKINDPPAELRNGMNAEVRIYVERQSDALQVPVQALAEHKGHFFALVKSGGKYETREVSINSTNDKVAVIKDGLAEKDEVVMNPRGQPAMFHLPSLPDETTAQIADIPRAAGTPAIMTASLSGNPGIPGPGAPGEGGPPGEGAGGERPKGKGKGKAGAFTPANIVDRALEESDTDKDGKISMAELASMEDRRKQNFQGGDANGDGFLDRAEMMNAATAAMAARARERMEGGGGGGPPAGGGQ
ncbi:MAG TPA: efflux RND transporter periplasmic adaptor subunit, partial [Pirellulaceae bacterium]|nr:efflux RND transporter periplasmic adaptor subunit [Pirellulaceae bacterium]